MKVSHIHLTRAVIALILGSTLASSPALAERFTMAEFPGISLFREYRCRNDDSISSNEVGRARVEWARACGLLSEDNLDLMLWRISRNKIVPREFVGYPTFAFNQAKYPVWIPNLTPHADGSPRCEIPRDVIWFGVCVVGCYAPEELVLFESGYEPIGKAAVAGRSNLMTLDPASSQGHISFTSSPVAAYSSDIAEEMQRITTIRMASGGSLRVTPNHPVVVRDGSIRAVEDLEVGDALVNVHGDSDEIVTLSTQEVSVQVFNVKPASEDPQRNVIVAQGYLNGSSRYQNEFVAYLNRQALRASIPNDCLER